jgi:hypothetical protein
MKIFGFSAVVIGLALLVLSLSWRSIFPAEQVWSESQAKEHSEASALYHQLQHTVGGHSHGPLGSRGKAFTKADLNAAKERWEKSNAQLLEAKDRGKQAMWWLMIGGVAVTAVGAGALTAVQRRAAKAGKSTRR